MNPVFLSPFVVALRLTLILGGLWAGGFLLFVTTLPGQVTDAVTHTDAIVVLTGGRDRLGTGLDLLTSQLGDSLFVSGVPRGVDQDDVLRQIGRQQDHHDPRIQLGHLADDTVGNAQETALWVRDRKITSLRLVTGAYHMPRALLEFRHAMPDIAIVPHPVFPDAVKSREWWRWPGTAALLATEYSKTVAAMIRHWFLPRRSVP